MTSKDLPAHETTCELLAPVVPEGSGGIGKSPQPLRKQKGAREWVTGQSELLVGRVGVGPSTGDQRELRGQLPSPAEGGRGRKNRRSPALMLTQPRPLVPPGVVGTPCNSRA